MKTTCKLSKKRILKFTLPVTQGCTHLKMGYGYVSPLKPPFLDHFPRPHFRIFHFFKTLRSPEIKNFMKNLHFRASKSGKRFSSTPTIWSNFSSMSFKLDKKKNQFSKFGHRPFSKPLFLALQAVKWKLSTTPGPVIVKVKIIAENLGP